MNRFSLAEVSPRLAADYGVRVDYRDVYAGVVNGRIAATRERGRWYVTEDQLPEIARALGLTPQPNAGRRQKTVAAQAAPGTR